MLSKNLFLSSAAFFVLVSLPLIGSVGASSEMWSQTYGGASSDSAEAMVQTSDGGYALAGATNIRINHSDADFWLIKTDAYGNMLWNKTYSKDVDYADSVVETSDGGYALAGSTGFWYPHAFWLVKTDETGNMKWNKKYGGIDHGHFASARSLVVTSDGGFALAGKTDHAGAGGYDFWLIKTDADGSMMWNQTYGGAEDDIAHSLVVTSDGGFAIAGETSSFGAGDSDFWLVKTNEYGIIPEFPSWIIIPLFLTATLAAIFYSKRVRARLRHF